MVTEYRMERLEQRIYDEQGAHQALSRVRAAFNLLPRNVFVVHDNAPVIAHELDLPLETVIEVFQTPHPVLFPDVPAAFERMSAAGSLPIVWTQGHLDQDKDFGFLQSDQELSFQALKIVRSGLHGHLIPFGQRLSQLGLPHIVGGFNKCDPRIVLPVLENACEGGIERVFAVDDLSDNLEQMGELCMSTGISYVPLLIDRKKKSRTADIYSFDELTFVENTLYFLDLDRTQIDTDGMKQEMFARLACCIE